MVSQRNQCLAVIGVLVALAVSALHCPSARAVDYVYAPISFTTDVTATACASDAARQTLNRINAAGARAFDSGWVNASIDLAGTGSNDWATIASLSTIQSSSPAAYTETLAHGTMTIGTSDVIPAGTPLTLGFLVTTTDDESSLLQWSFDVARESDTLLHIAGNPPEMGWSNIPVNAGESLSIAFHSRRTGVCDGDFLSLSLEAYGVVPEPSPVVMLLGLGAVCLLAYVWRRRAASLFRGCNATSLCLVTTLVTVVICDESLAAEVRYFRGFGYYGPSYDDPLYDGSWFARDGRVWGLEISSPGPNDTAIFDADYVDPHPDYISLGDYWRQDSEYPVRGEVATIDSMFVQSGTYHLQFAPNVSSPPIPNPPPPQRGGLDIRNALTVSGGNLYLSGLGAIGTCCGPVSTRADKFFVGGIGTTANVSVENGAALYSNLADIGRATGQHASLAVDGPGSTWYVMGSGYLEVGHDSSPPSPVISGGRMTMDITGGAAVYSGPSVIVAAAGNVAKVTVSGSESLWDAGEILIQGPGDATLEVRSQGTVLSSSVSINGSAVVRDPGSVWKVGTEYTQGDMHVLGKLTVESQGSLIASSLDVSGTVKIGGSRPNFDPGTVTVGGTTTVAAPAGGSARIALTRAGSKLIMRDLDLGNQVGDQAGSLQIFQGSHVDATNVSVHPNSLLAMDIRKGSLLELAPEGTFTNDGVVYLSVSAISSFGSPLPAGGKYFPILSENWAGTGSYVTVGGHWDNLEHAFIMSEEGHGTKGSPITVDLQTTQRVVIENLETGRSVGLSFGAASSSLSLTANIISDSDLYDLQDSIAPGQSIQAAWDFAIASGYQQGDPVYLSFDIGDGFSPDDLRIWHFDGDLWTSYKPNDLTYDGQNVSFTAYGFSGYAIAAVPEPQTLTLFGMALVGYAGYRLRRQRTTRPS